MLARRALAAAPDRLLERHAVHFDAAPDPHVVDRDAGVLAQQVLPLLGDSDVLDHGVEHGAAGGVGLRRHQPFEAALDVRRQAFLNEEERKGTLIRAKQESINLRELLKGLAPTPGKVDLQGLMDDIREDRF